MHKNCEVCGREFYAPPARVRQGYARFCSRACYGTWRKGKDFNRAHPQSRAAIRRAGGTMQTTCHYCGTHFAAMPNKETGRLARFCSAACRYAGRIRRVSVACTWCGKIVRRFPGKLLLNEGRAFCTLRCRGAYTSATQRGENHPNWHGGPGNPYPREYYQKRGAILARDGRCCVVCASTSRLVVHHIDENPQNNSSDNLVTVCCKCHRGPIHGRHEITFDAQRNPISCKAKMGDGSYCKSKA